MRKLKIVRKVTSGICMDSESAERTVFVLLTSKCGKGHYYNVSYTLALDLVQYNKEGSMTFVCYYLHMSSRKGYVLITMEWTCSITYLVLLSRIS